jgi:hypothetical protein
MSETEWLCFNTSSQSLSYPRRLPPSNSLRECRDTAAQHFYAPPNTCTLSRHQLSASRSLNMPLRDMIFCTASLACSSGSGILSALKRTDKESPPLLPILYDTRRRNRPNALKKQQSSPLVEIRLELSFQEWMIHSQLPPTHNIHPLFRFRLQGD